MNGNTPVARISEVLQSKCEIAAVNGTLDQPQVSSLLELEHCNESASDLREMQSNGTLQAYVNPRPSTPQATPQSNSPELRRRKNEMIRSESLPAFPIKDTTDLITQEALEKIDRCDYFYYVRDFKKTKQKT